MWFDKRLMIEQRRSKRSRFSFFDMVLSPLASSASPLTSPTCNLPRSWRVATEADQVLPMSAWSVRHEITPSGRRHRTVWQIGADDQASWNPTSCIRVRPLTNLPTRDVQHRSRPLGEAEMHAHSQVFKSDGYHVDVN